MKLLERFQQILYGNFMVKFLVHINHNINGSIYFQLKLFLNPTKTSAFGWRRHCLLALYLMSNSSIIQQTWQ